MTAQPEMEAMPEPDRLVSEAFELLYNRVKRQIPERQKWEAVAAGIGIKEATLRRRRDGGGWTWLEVALLASYFNVPVAAIAGGEMSVMRYLAEQAEQPGISPTTRGKSGDSSDLTPPFHAADLTEQILLCAS